MIEEGLKETDNHLIHMAKPLHVDTDDFLIKLNTLMTEAYNNDAQATVQTIRETVTTYTG